MECVCLSDDQENTNIKLIQIMETILDLRIKFNKERETFKRTRV